MKPNTNEYYIYKECYQTTATYWIDFEMWIWIQQHRGNPTAPGASCSTCSSAERLPWTRLNQISTHWPPDRDYSVVRVRTAGPAHTLLGESLTAHMGVSCHTQHKVWMYIWFLSFKNSSVYCTAAKTASWNRSQPCYHRVWQQSVKINGGLELEYNVKLKRLFMQLTWGGICSFYVCIIYLIFYFVRWN